MELGFYGRRLGFFYFGCQIRVEILLFRVEILLLRVEIPDFGFPLFWCQVGMPILVPCNTQFFTEMALFRVPILLISSMFKYQQAARYK